MKCTKCGNTLYNRPKSRMCWGCEKKDTTLPDHLRINPKYYTTKNTATKNGTLKEEPNNPFLTHIGINRFFMFQWCVDKWVVYGIRGYKTLEECKKKVRRGEKFKIMKLITVGVYSG